VDYSAQGNRLNRRGLETRRQILETAVQCLADGGSEAVSANLIAKTAGVTWGTIQHQFRDSDGLWAAVIDCIAADVESYWERDTNRESSLPIRVKAIVDAMWLNFNEPNARAVRNLRLSLPRDDAGLARDFPATADAFRRFDSRWATFFDQILDGLPSSKVKLRRVRYLLPSAVQGIHVRAQMSNSKETDEARKGLVDALVAYLTE
jgi:AcrR family transcriptional regulator